MQPNAPLSFLSPDAIPADIKEIFERMHQRILRRIEAEMTAGYKQVKLSLDSNYYLRTIVIVLRQKTYKLFTGERFIEKEGATTTTSLQHLQR